MLQSHIIEIDGVFVGAAIRLDRGYRFVATDLRLEELDQSIWPTLADVQRLARRLYLNGSFVEPGSPAASATARVLPASR
ncbi:MAG TPA: hypothetical protein VMQ99_06115 [Acetobacteraceae bacterium]|jgi:hypothetical protein|nr:hypothetical protein [Acetobacteraceae bacterium]